jgi:hypothetical protein
MYFLRPPSSIIKHSQRKKKRIGLLPVRSEQGDKIFYFILEGWLSSRKLTDF